MNLPPAVVFGMFETGLGVARSLGQKGIKVYGVDFKRDIGFYSRYISPMICPNPVLEEDKFIEWVKHSFGEDQKLPVFITSDQFMVAISKNIKELETQFILNLPDYDLLRKIDNKFSQYTLAVKTSVPVPQTHVVKKYEDVNTLTECVIQFPVIVKGLDVTTWRSNISSSIKGFEAKDHQHLLNIVKPILDKNVPCLIQEIIPGPDTNHVKYSCYVSKTGSVVAEFMLKKIRQHPIHFGIGSAVESISDDKLRELGHHLFSSIGYRGVGSAEFKFDERERTLKLIEINPRYWQQNYLTTACGYNMAFLNYCDLIESPISAPTAYRIGVKWVNIYADFDSYLGYSREGSLSFVGWLQSLRGKKTWSDFIIRDPIPVFYEYRFGARFLRHPIKALKYIFKIVFG